MKRRDLVLGLGGAAGAALAVGGLMPRAGRAEAPAAGDATAVSSAPSPPWPVGAAKGDIAVAERSWDRAMSGAIPGLGRSDALVIIQDGRLVLERYGRDHGPATRHVSWSMAKSFTQALVGAAVLQGRIDPDRPLTTVAHPDPKLTLRSLLTLTDGLAWDEAAYSVVDSDATKMLYGPGRLNGAAYAGGRSLAYPPGTHWRYSTGSFQLAAAELQALIFPTARDPRERRAAMSGWMRESLFAPLGMDTAVAEFDPSGGLYGGSLIYASARDYARFGELYRLDGIWGGKRLLPEGWVKFARTPTIKPDYGAGFWLEAKAGADGKPLGLMGGAGPMDAYSAEGHSGQVVLVVPSKKLVLVRLGLTEGANGFKFIGDWLVPILAALPDMA
ncbi:MAG: hypothetical protein JWP35_4451 [Caulobacter sp.]|nr:hypothetical protein [Caulobacter sp.]